MTAATLEPIFCEAPECPSRKVTYPRGRLIGKAAPPYCVELKCPTCRKVLVYKSP